MLIDMSGTAVDQLMPALPLLFSFLFVFYQRSIDSKMLGDMEGRRICCSTLEAGGVEMEDVRLIRQALSERACGIPSASSPHTFEIPYKNCSVL